MKRKDKTSDRERISRKRPPLPTAPEWEEREDYVPEQTSRPRYTRGFFGLLLWGLLILGIGSYFMRSAVIRILTTRSLTDSSVVLSRPFPLAAETNIRAVNLPTRLQRLGYQEVSHVPEQPGQYSRSANELLLYLRQTILPDTTAQPEQLIRCSLSADGTIQEIHNYKFNQPLSQIWLDSEVLAQLGDSELRASSPQRLGDFPQTLVDAVLAIEDERFYHHFGIDPIGIMRAMATNLQSGKVVQGGSTITQQLAKGLFFSSHRSIVRKILEAGSAILIETAFSKDQILEFYLNEVFIEQVGNTAIHGFAEGARSLFGKNIKDLSLSESAMLAGIVKAPSNFSPRKNPERAKERRDVVLQKMFELGKITEHDRDTALASNLHVVAREQSFRPAPYFVDYVRQQIDSLANAGKLGSEPVRIFTGIDREYQRCAQTAVDDGLSELEKTYKRLRRKSSPLQASLIAVTPADGQILAWIGGRNYGENQFDRVTQAHRQPGSAFKPFVYLTALDDTLNDYRVARTTSILPDRPITISVPGSGDWEPENYEKTYRGEVTVREALTHSLNIPTIDLAMKVGIDSVAATAEMFGFGENLPRVPSLALGAGEVTLYQLAHAYAGLANGGMIVELEPLTGIVRADNNHGVPLPPHYPERVATEPAVYVLTNIMQSVIDRGTGEVVRRMGFDRPVAGKTGTSNDTRDSWFVGFTPRLLAAAWVGFDDNKQTGLTGAMGAAPIWTRFMKCVEPFEPNLDFIPPDGVVFKSVDSASGLLATPNCPSENIVTEVFVSGYDPVTPCNLHSAGATEIPTQANEPVLEADPNHLPSKSPPNGRKTWLENLWWGR